jgi:hypothetical protein
MTDEEYSEYIKDKKELENFRRIKADFPEVAREYFEHNARNAHWAKDHLMTECIMEKSKEPYRYCDFCPFPRIFGCPLGHMVEYSK